MSARLRVCVVIFEVLALQSCAGETQERPRESVGIVRSDAVRPSDEPLPTTAFKDEASGDARFSFSVPPKDVEGRFVTRSIGQDGFPQRFRGAPVDLDLRGAEIRDAFRLLAEVGKVNIVVPGEVSGTITMRLRRVPWDQAMDVIARMRGLAYERDGNVILVRAAGTK